MASENGRDRIKLRQGERRERPIEMKIVESSRGDNVSDFSQPGLRPGESGHRHAPAEVDTEDLQRILGDPEACVHIFAERISWFRKEEPVFPSGQIPSADSSEATASAPAAMKLSSSSVGRISFMERTRSSLATVERNGLPPDNARTVFR